MSWMDHTGYDVHPQLLQSLGLNNALTETAAATGTLGSSMCTPPSRGPVVQAQYSNQNPPFPPKKGTFESSPQLRERKPDCVWLLHKDRS